MKLTGFALADHTAPDFKRNGQRNRHLNHRPESALASVDPAGNITGIRVEISRKTLNYTRENLVIVNASRLMKGLRSDTLLSVHPPATALPKIVDPCAIEQ